VSLIVTSGYLFDTVAPAPPVFTHTPDTAGWFWDFTSEPDAMADCSIDGGPWSSCSGPVRATPGDREAHLEIRARDAAGNHSAAVGAGVSTIVTVVMSVLPKETGGAAIPEVNLRVTSADTATTSGFTVFTTFPAPIEAAAPPAALLATPQVLVVDPHGDLPPVAALLQVAAERTTVPLLLVLLVVAFVAVQNRIDRRDPKLISAPVRHEPEYLEFQ
jgi:hypothetical protein